VGSSEQGTRKLGSLVIAIGIVLVMIGGLCTLLVVKARSTEKTTSPNQEHQAYQPTQNPPMPAQNREPKPKPVQDASRSRRQIRWSLTFHSVDGDDYARQLQALKATVIIQDARGRILCIDDLSARPVTLKPASYETFPRIFWCDEEPRSVASLATALGLEPIPARIQAYLPPQVEMELLDKEMAYRNLPEDSIVLTRFRFRRVGGTYDLCVVEQTDIQGKTVRSDNLTSTSPLGLPFPQGSDTEGLDAKAREVGAGEPPQATRRGFRGPATQQTQADARTSPEAPQAGVRGRRRGGSQQEQVNASAGSESPRKKFEDQLKEEEQRRKVDLAKRQSIQNDQNVIRNYITLNVPNSANILLTQWYEPLEARALKNQSVHGKLYRVSAETTLAIVNSVGQAENKRVFVNLYFFVVDGAVRASQTSEQGYRSVKCCKILVPIPE
jgi:hypothetical protein